MAASAKQLAFTLCLIGLIAGSACAASDKLKYQITQFGSRESNRRVLLLRMDLIYHPTPSAASGAPSPPTADSEARYRASPGSPEAEFMEMTDKILALVRESAAAFDKEMFQNNLPPKSLSNADRRKYLAHNRRKFWVTGLSIER